MTASDRDRYALPHPQQCVSKRKQSILTERTSSQEHFIDRRGLIGHLTPAEADPTDERFIFEKEASKQSGGQGRG